MKNQLNVLLVDDNESFLKILSKSLRDRGYFVSTAKSHSEALEILINKIYHVAFIDCILFSEEGVDLAHKIHRILGYSVEIVLMSGVLSSKNIEGIEGLNQVRFLKKPIKNKDVNSILQSIKNTVIYGEVDNFLLKLFKKDISDKDKLKLLFNLETVNDVGFFPTLIQLLNTGEKGSVKFSFDNQPEHEIFFEDKVIVNYICYNSQFFIDQLVADGHLEQKDSKKIYNLKAEDLDQEIIAQCYTSPNAIAKVKDKLMLKVLNEIPNKQKIKLESKLFKSSHCFFQINRESLIQTISSLVVKLNPSSLKSLFGESMMECTVVSNEEMSNENLSEIIAEPVKLKQLKSNKKFKTDLDFYHFIFNLLLESQILLQTDQGKHFHIKRRFQSLYSYLKNKDAKTIIQIIGQLEPHSIPSHDMMKSIYLKFVAFNHADKLPHLLEEDIVQYVNLACDKVKVAYKELIDPSVQLALNEKIKAEQMNKEIRRMEDKKMVTNFLINEKYTEGLNNILSQDEAIVEKDIEWQILYLWVTYKIGNEAKIREEKMKRFLNNLIRDTMNLDSKSLYFYILGLHHMQFKKTQKALESFQRTKLIDPSFKPVHKDLKKIILEQSRSTKALSFSNLISIINKKTG